MCLHLAIRRITLYIWGEEMEKSIGETLAGLRKAKKYMQKDVAAKLSAYGFSVNAKTIYNWEKSISQPGIPQFLALCDIFEIDDVLWQFAGIHKGAYAGLNQSGRDKAREFIDLIFRISEYRDEPEESSPTPRLLCLYDLPTSAGAGMFLDESAFEMIAAPAYVSSGADYALRVSGDSMEPLLQDGQIIYVKKQQALEVGEIGVFGLNGDSYVKKLGVGELISLNPGYDPIRIGEFDEIHVFGKVVG